MHHNILPAGAPARHDGPVGPGASCPRCGGAGMTPRRVSTAFWDVDRLVVISDIPALVCRACGEDFISDETSATLSAMRLRGFVPETAPRVMQVPVFPFSVAAAADRA